MRRPILYYITDRTQFPGTEAERRQKLLAKIREAGAHAIDFIQLREKDLSSRELEILARQALDAIRQLKSSTRLLINSRSDIALAVGADGVHRRADDISVPDVRVLCGAVQTRHEGVQLQAYRSEIESSGASAHEGGSSRPEPETARTRIIGVSCHSEKEVQTAAWDGADFVVFAPVFEKKGNHPAGLDALHRACQYRVPVLALGGVTLENAQSCLDAGAAGIAGIRLFQQNDISEALRGIGVAGGF